MNLRNTDLKEGSQNGTWICEISWTECSRMGKATLDRVLSILGGRREAGGSAQVHKVKTTDHSSDLDVNNTSLQCVVLWGKGKGEREGGRWAAARERLCCQSHTVSEHARREGRLMGGVCCWVPCTLCAAQTCAGTANSTRQGPAI